MTIHRFEGVQSITSITDPFTVLNSWIAGLGSAGYVSDLLREIHGFNDKSEIASSAKLIATFAENAVGLIEQALSGSPEVAFLPIYYSLQNLAKIYVVLTGRRRELLGKDHRSHGVTRRQRVSRSLLSEELVLKPRGTIPLFYQSITGEMWGKTDVIISLAEIYPYVSGVTYEFEQLYKRKGKLNPIHIELREDESQHWSLAAKLVRPSKSKLDGLDYFKVLKDFKKHPTEPHTFVGRTRHKDFAEAKKRCIADLRRMLLNSERGIRSPTVTLYLPMTPVSNSDILLPTELPILLAFFHLSTLVRYFPEKIAQLRDSRAWSLLLNMRRDTAYSFMLAFWSNLHKTNYVLHLT